MRRRTSLMLASVLAPCVLALGACGSEPEKVTLGGTTAVSAPETVERPWGTVKVFPEMQKAEAPGADDVVFAQEMVMHHEQAIELGRNLLAHEGLDERIEATARFIVKDQKNEIGIMGAWLDAWEEAAAEHGSHADSDMPGMLPQSRVDEIATLPTDAGQVAFLVAMIEHHDGAITMSKDYLPVQANTFTRSSAQHIITEQLTEIQYMENVIDDLCQDGGPGTCPPE